MLGQRLWRMLVTLVSLPCLMLLVGCVGAKAKENEHVDSKTFADLLTTSSTFAGWVIIPAVAMALMAGFIIIFTSDKERREYSSVVGGIALSFVLALAAIVLIVA